MSDLFESILLSTFTGLLVSTITVLIDFYIPISKKLIHGILRTFIIAVCFIVLLFALSNPHMTIMQRSISVDYIKDKGLELSGSFKNISHRNMYILVREEKPGDLQQVWTVITKIIDFDHQRSTWASRIYLTSICNKIFPDSLFSIIGIITKENLKTNSKIIASQISELQGYKTSVLNITVRNIE